MNCHQEQSSQPLAEQVLSRTSAPAAHQHAQEHHDDESHDHEHAFEWLDGPVLRVTAADVPLPYAPTLEDYVLPQTDDIVNVARKLAAY